MDALLLVLVILTVYFFPAGLASSRGHQNAGAITVLNLFLGWTLLGWVVALVWACTAVKVPAPAPTVTEETKKCPVCAERVKREAIRCRFCGYDFVALATLRDEVPKPPGP